MSAAAGPNMGAIQSMNLANQGADNPKAYPGIFAIPGVDKSFKETTEVGVKGPTDGLLGMVGGATGEKSSNPLRNVLSQVFHIKDLWALHEGGGTGVSASSSAGAESSHMAGSTASDMATEIIHNSGGGFSENNSSSSGTSSGNNGSNHPFSAVGSASQDFATSGATYEGNVPMSQLGLLSPSTSQGKGKERGAGAGMGTS